MGHPAWTQEERFATLFNRKSNEEALDKCIGAWTQGWEAHNLMRTLQAVGVPAGAVLKNKEVVEDPQLNHRGHFVYMDHPGVGWHPVQRSEFRLSDAQAEFKWAAPTMGQHTVQVCKEILGMEDDEINALIEENVLEIDTSPEASLT
jgi:crotonobetainyl-CoA:carnitine CoA-transferase CaiB-like acyl-CoA transferase